MQLIFPSQFRKWSSLYDQLGSLVKSGTPILDAFAQINQDPPSPEIKRVCSQIIHGLKSGRVLSQAMRPLQKTIPALDLALLEAGEKSGRFELILKTLAQLYAHEASWRAKLIQQLLYPLFLLHMAFFIFPSSELAPIANGNFKEFFIPKLIRLAILWGILILPFWLSQSNQSKKVRANLEKVLHTIPLIGSIQINSALARFCLALESLTAAGITPDTSWPLAGRASGSVRIDEAITKFLPRLKKGTPPSELLNSQSLFPAHFRSLYKTGEISGQLDEALIKLGAYYRERADLLMQSFVDWLPKLVYFVVAILIGYQIFGSVKAASEVKMPDFLN